MITSKIETTEVNAAINNKKKNSAPKMTPPGICKKTFGKVMKTNPGPDVGSIPKAKTAGKMASPPNKAIIVSAAAIDKVVEVKFSFLPI